MTKKTMHRVTIMWFTFLTGVYLLRVLLHSVLGLRFDAQGMGFTDYEVVLPSTIAFFLLMHSLTRGSILTLKIHLPSFLSYLVFATAFVVWNLHLAENSPGLLSVDAIWVVLLALAILPLLTVLTGPQFYLLNANRRFILPALLLSFSVAIYQHSFHLLWPQFAPLSGQAACSVIKPFLGDSLRCISSEMAGTAMKHRFFWATIAPGCSGLDGIFFFLFTLALAYLLNPKRVSFSSWILILLSGLNLMFLLNVLRIATLFVVGVISAQTSFHELGREAVLFAFHAHTGWILYSAALFVFYRTLFQFLKPTDSSSNRRGLPIVKIVKPSMT